MAHIPKEWVQYTFKLSLSLSFCANGPWALVFVYTIFQRRSFKKLQRLSRLKMGSMQFYGDVYTERQKD